MDAVLIIPADTWENRGVTHLLKLQGRGRHFPDTLDLPVKHLGVLVYTIGLFQTVKLSAFKEFKPFLLTFVPFFHLLNTLVLLFAFNFPLPPAVGSNLGPHIHKQVLCC